MDYLYSGVVGAGVTVAFWMFRFRPDPPPPMRWLVVMLASFVGGAIGGALGGSVGIAGSNPMPGHNLVGAAALGLLAGGAAIVLGAARTGAAGR